MHVRHSGMPCLWHAYNPICLAIAVCMWRCWASVWPRGAGMATWGHMALALCSSFVWIWNVLRVVVLHQQKQLLAPGMLIGPQAALLCCVALPVGCGSTTGSLAVWMWMKEQDTLLCCLVGEAARLPTATPHISSNHLESGVAA